MTQHLKALKKETQKSLNEKQENTCLQTEDLKKEKKKTKKKEKQKTKNINYYRRSP